jgi:hypothetical protein
MSSCCSPGGVAPVLAVARYGPIRGPRRPSAMARATRVGRSRSVRTGCASTWWNPARWRPKYSSLYDEVKAEATAVILDMQRFLVTARPVWHGARKGRWSIWRMTPIRQWDLARTEQFLSPLSTDLRAPGRGAPPDRRTRTPRVSGTTRRPQLRPHLRARVRRRAGAAGGSGSPPPSQPRCAATG